MGTNLVTSATKKTNDNLTNDDGEEEDYSDDDYSDDDYDDDDWSRSVPKRKKSDIPDQKKRSKKSKIKTNTGGSRDTIEKITKIERKKKENNNSRSGFMSLSDQNINNKKEKNRNIEEDSMNSTKRFPTKNNKSGDSRNVVIDLESESDEDRMAAMTTTTTMEKINVLDSFDVILPPSIVNGGDNSGGDQCTVLVEV